MNSQKNQLIIDEIYPLDLSLTLDCGQSFRWQKNDDGSWHGVVKGRAVDVEIKDGSLVISGDVSESDRALWREYFDLDRNYGEICASLCADKWLKRAIEEYPGIRILKQDPWEALCSFIISQNNNIPRIKGIIARLCTSFGKDLGNGDFAFPDAKTIAEKTPEALAPLRAGFRVKYILDCAEKTASGKIDLNNIGDMPMEEARAELQKISGVGPKVAECALLYGFGRVEAFPVDVWVRRIMEELYPEGLPKCTRGVEGIAQQYLFHWRRNIENSVF